MKEEVHWKNIQSIGMVTRLRQLNGAKPTFEAWFFISSLPADAAKLAKDVRSHWQMENNLHWTLDVAFREDECRVRMGYGAENSAMLRHDALNLLKAEQTAKVGIKTKRLMAGWNKAYHLKTLGF